MPISLRLLSVSIACMIPISSLALTLGKVDVQSAIDEPLRATVNVNNIAVPLTQLKAGVATASAYSRLGASRQSLPNLRFLLKDLGQGNAQMWIVSNERISEPFVDLVIHITEGDLITTHPLPLILAAPDSSAQQIQLERRVTTPPVIATAPSASTKSTPAANPPSQASSSVSGPKTTSAQAPKPASKAKVDLPKAKVAKASKLGDNAERTDYRVKNRETLSGIASRYARGSNISLDTAMSGILALNPNAFINNNPNLIKANAQIKLPSYNEATKVASQLSNPVSMQSLANESTQTTPRANSSAQASSETKPSAPSKTEQPKAPRTKAAPTSQAKPADLKLDIVSASPKAPSGDATAQPSETTRNLPTELGNKVSKVRQSTIAKRQSVNQLITQLNTYNAKIKLQNARLAELESKLKSLNKTNK